MKNNKYTKPSSDAYPTPFAFNVKAMQKNKSPVKKEGIVEIVKFKRRYKISPKGR